MTKLFVTELIETLENQRVFAKEVENLSSEQFNFIPKGSKNSIGKLLEHMTGVEKMLIHKVIFGSDVTRDRDKEFGDRVRSVAELLKEYTLVAQESKRLLETLDDEKLSEERMLRETKRTVLNALTRAIAHNNYHIGQIYLLLAMVKQL